MSFQNIERVAEDVSNLFGVGIRAVLSSDHWTSLVRAFQKRHLVAHNMGVIDQQYLDRTKDPAHLLGRGISITESEVRQTVASLRKISIKLSESVTNSDGRGDAQL